MENIEAKSLSDSAVTVLGQMFVYGPTWDGNIIAKCGRDELVKAGLAKKVNGGWNFLTEEGVAVAAEWTFAKLDTHLKQCWHRKACGR